MRKISNARATRHFNKYVLSGEEKVNPRVEITDKNSFKLFPFELTMGYITSTENGIRQNDNVNVFDYSTFSRVFTGLENVLAQWESAYKVEKAKANDTFLTKTYQVGRNLNGIITDENLQAQFEASSISGDFLTEFTSETFDVEIHEDLQVTDLYKLYIIPQLKEEKWLYISNANKYYNQDKSFHHATVTFTTLNNKIEKTGRAVEEFIQRSAAGEGYTWPVVNNDNSITIDLIRNRDVPITSMQIEGAGAAAMGTMFCYGRPTIQKTENGVTEGTFNPKIEAPRLLIPLRIETALPSPVNTRPSAETDWLIGDFAPTLEEDFNDWKEELKASYDLTQRAKYEGMLKSISTDATVNATNPINEGTRNNLLWDASWLFEVDKTYNTATVATAVDKLELKGQYSLPQLLCHNIFGLSPYSALPLSVEQNVSWNLKNIPLIGGFLSKVTFGIPIGWTNTSVKVKMDGVVVAIPASLRDYANVLIKDSDKLRIDLNTFTDEAASTDAVEFSGIKATGSIWKCSLTDRFSKTLNGTAYIFNTVDLGQNHPTVDDEGKAIPAADIPKDDDGNNLDLQWDVTCKPAPRNTNTPGYVIDLSTFKAIAKIDYRSTFFSNDIQVWSGTYQTTSKFTDSLRDWTNTTKYSNWNEDNNLQIDYPANIVAPNPPTANNPIIELNEFEKNLSIEQTQNINSEFTLQPGGSGDPFQIGIIRSDKTYTSNAIPFDTTKYGGINSINQNYLTIDINIKENNVNRLLSINLLDLINSTEKEIELTKDSSTFPMKVSNQDLTATITNSDLKLSIKINGNNIELSIIGDYQFNFSETRATSFVPTYPVTYEKQITNIIIDSAILKPKPII